MAFFHRPGRNNDSPGDPPPLWGLSSRRSRVVVTITIVAGIVIGLVLAASRSLA